MVSLLGNDYRAPPLDAVIELVIVIYINNKYKYKEDRRKPKKTFRHLRDPNQERIPWPLRYWWSAVTAWGNKPTESGHCVDS